jgi:hypothetical protein
MRCFIALTKQHIIVPSVGVLHPLTRHRAGYLVAEEAMSVRDRIHFNNNDDTLWWINGTVIPRFTSLIRYSKTAHKAKTHKMKINFQEEAPGITISLREVGARISENWLVNSKTGINLCISYKRKLIN